MDMRFVITNGKDYLQLFWLRHDSKNMYWGCPSNFDDIKLSYHESGQYHAKTGNNITFKEQSKPLDEIDECFTIWGNGPINNPGFFEGFEIFKKYTGKKLETIVVFDIRPYPYPEFQINVNFGVTEPGNFQLIKERIWDGFSQVSHNVYQFHLITHTRPWIWTVLNGWKH